jgi:predicted AlkP superfamily phosphohydrolase/phosphomutase
VAERRAFVLCLDGENLELLDRFSREFGLAHLRRMLDEGRSGPLDPGLLPVTPPAWSSFLTGVGFPRHGVLGFLRHDPRSHRDSVVTFSDIRRETFLAAADRQGARVASVNLPMTSGPLCLRHGDVVSGFMVKDAEGARVWPEDLGRRIRARVPGYRTRLPSWPPGTDDSLTRIGYLRECVRRMRWREAVLEEVLGATPPRITVVHCAETDILHHVAWDAVSSPKSVSDELRGLLREVYESADRIAGVLLGSVGEDGLGLVVSDHGGAAKTWVFQPNDLLAHWGYATLLDGADGTLSRPGEFGRGMAARARRFIRRRLLREPEVAGSGFRAETVDREILLDFRSTRLYVGIGDLACMFYGGDGPALSTQELEAVRRRLEDHRLPDGTKPLAQVLRGVDVFGRDPAWEGIAPLLVGVVTDGIHVSRRAGSGDAFQNRHLWEGTHRRLGMFCWRGPGVEPGTVTEPMDITSVYPTMFGAIGLHFPPGLDGRPLPGVEPRPAAGSWDEAGLEPPIPAEAVDSKEDDEEIRRRLRDLGYTD